jgi:hypothetical protein
MSFPALIARLFIVTAAGLLAGSYWLAGYLPVSLAILALALLSLLCLLRRWSWSVSILMVLYTAIAATGFYLELRPAWLASSVVLTLAAWDLVYFARHLQFAGLVASPSRLILAHLLRLLWVTLLGSALFWVAYQIRLQFTFGLAILMASAAIYGLSQGIAYLRRSGN